MNVTKYTELTGITVSQSKQARFTANIRKTKAILESMLGYPLTKKDAQINQYEEAGKTASECGCDNIDGELSDADEVVGAYRLFPYNGKDPFLEVDPFTRLHTVKLVHIRSGDEPNGVTVRTFEQDQIRVQMRQGFSKFIEKCDDCYCLCECSDCVQLAIDADWMFDSCLPDELLYIWAEMVTYESKPKKDLKRETLATHTYERFDRKNPYELSENLKILTKYAGPNGTLSRTLTV